jgi:cyanophycinase
MGGGDPALYRQTFVASPAGPLIVGRVALGVPYGGVSAGAILAATISHAGPGLGLLPDAVIEAHFTEWGRLPHLVDLLVSTGAGLGLGVDEKAGAEIRDGTLTGRGEGSVWLVEPGAEDRLLVRQGRPGATLRLD